jgi:uncharacterized protein
MASNVLGTPLQTCSLAPRTGFFRNGCCDTNASDTGQHTICAEMTETFLSYSQSVGNDLSTPVPEYQFPGLKAGDFWCLCLPRWIQAHQDGMAPRVKLQSCHVSVLEFIDLALLQAYAVNSDD